MILKGMVNKLKLGKLEEVDIRELWKHEQYDFSEWLSKEENIEMLGDELPSPSPGPRRPRAPPPD